MIYINQSIIIKLNFPCVWKKTKFGYDGFGVKILKSVDDTIDLPKTEMIIEDLVPFEKELSVIVSRNLMVKLNVMKLLKWNLMLIQIKLNLL